MRSITPPATSPSVHNNEAQPSDRLDARLTCCPPAHNCPVSNKRRRCQFTCCHMTPVGEKAPGHVGWWSHLSTMLFWRKHKIFSIWCHLNPTQPFHTCLLRKMTLFMTQFLVRVSEEGKVPGVVQDFSFLFAASGSAFCFCRGQGL